MLKETVKLLLASYRPEQANDPIFAEALREVAKDAELAAWFKEAQRFDALMTDKFRGVPVPGNVKSHVFLGAMTARPEHRPPRPWRAVLAIAASVTLVGALCWQVAGRRPSMQRIAMQAIAFTSEMPALQFVCFDPAAVASWVNEQPCARQMNLTLPKLGKEFSMTLIGSSVVEWDGQPVVMVCLQDGKRMAMLYMLPSDRAAFALGEGVSETVQRGDWVARTTRVDGQVRVLTTKGQPRDLDFPVPF